MVKSLEWLIVGLSQFSLLSTVRAAVTPDWHPQNYTTNQAQQTLSSAGTCCGALHILFPKKIVYPGSTIYNDSLNSYWSVQEADVHPTCIFTPTTKDDVSLAVFVLNVGSKVLPQKCDFAIRSGGHTPWAGSANIASGVTIDLSNFTEITVSADKTAVRLGTGNRWEGVYRHLDALNLATSGGRVAIVGVGGLVTGGGISFFSPRYGYVCDNVNNFEVVLASGQIVNASATTNTDLWRALRGGSNNFGIVTTFTMRVFPQGKLWGGFIGLDISTVEQQFQAFESLLGSPNYDPYAALIYSLVWNVTSNTWYSASNFEYTKPVANPPFFKNFTSLPQTFSTMRISNLTDFTVELSASNPNGNRQLFATGTYGNSAKMMSSIYEIGNTTAQPLLAVKGIKWSLSFQPQPTVILSTAAANGGNSLGLDTSDGNIFNVLLTATWDDEEDDALVEKQAKELFAQANTKAVTLGVSNEYIYLNYAAKWQNPIQGYGAASKANLQAASKKYDPTGIFQKKVPGGFKLFT